MSNHVHVCEQIDVLVVSFRCAVCCFSCAMHQVLCTLFGLSLCMAVSLCYCVFLLSTVLSYLFSWLYTRAIHWLIGERRRWKLPRSDYCVLTAPMQPPRCMPYSKRKWQPARTHFSTSSHRVRCHVHDS